MFWAPVFLSAATGSMLALPLVPSLRELHRRRDASPLPTRTDDGKVENFAESLREYMAPLVELNGSDTCRLRDGAVGCILRAAGVPALPDTPVEYPIYAPQSLTLPVPVCLLRELYVRGDLRVAGESLLRAVLVEGNASLGERTSIARWIHALGDLEAGPEARLFGRASAGGSITLRHGCVFERLRASVIYGGTQGKPIHEYSPVWRGTGLNDMRLGRVRSGGDFHLRDSDAFHGHIVAAGRVAIGENVLVIGNVKARTDLEIGSGTNLEGTAVSRGALSIAQRCYVKGPVLSEEEVIIGAGTQIGSPASPTTVSAPRVRLAPGAVVCGSIWARETGQVAA
jgi:molybdopterin-binding protein